jgi:hypothetical protein
MVCTFLLWASKVFFLRVHFSFAPCCSSSSCIRFWTFVAISTLDHSYNNTRPHPRLRGSIFMLWMMSIFMGWVFNSIGPFILMSCSFHLLSDLWSMFPRCCCPMPVGLAFLLTVNFLLISFQFFFIKKNKVYNVL